MTCEASSTLAVSSRMTIRSLERTKTMKKAIVLALAAMSVVILAVSPASASKRDVGCSASPGAVSLNQTYTVSAWGLPTNGAVNMVTTYPDGSSSIEPVSVAADGAYALTLSTASVMSAAQTGTYSYQFVGKVRWPLGTFNQSYATCSVQAG
jgi:hypothetical protein